MGPGGVGKTRLAWQAAEEMVEEFEHGVWFIRCDRVGDGLWSIPPAKKATWSSKGRDDGHCSRPSVILPLARALGVAPTGGSLLRTQLTDYLCRKEALLVLDDFRPTRQDVEWLEHVGDCAPLVRVLVVCDEAIETDAAQTLRLDGLPGPSSLPEELEAGTDLETLPRSGALGLFLEEIREVVQDTEFDSYEARLLVQLCEWTGGLPLAIKLVAPTLAQVSLGEAASRMARHAKAGPAQPPSEGGSCGTAQTALAYAWELLGTPRQLALSKLAFFREDFDEQAAEEIGGVSPVRLRALADRAWLWRLGAGRYVLHPVVRLFVRTKLKELVSTTETDHRAIDADGFRDRYVAHYLRLLSTRGALVLSRVNRATLDEVEPDWRNIRIAWQRAVAGGRIASLEESLGGLKEFLLLEGWLCEGQALLDATLMALQDVASRLEVGTLPARLLTGRACLLSAAGSFAAAADQARAAVAWVSDPDDPDLSWRAVKGEALVEWGRALYLQGELSAATERLKQALALAGDDESAGVRASAFYHLGAIGLRSQATGEAEAYLTRALELYESLGHGHGISQVCNELGLVAVQRGRYRTAESHLRRALELSQRIGDLRGESVAYSNLGRLASARGDYERATVLCEDALHIARNLADRLVEAQVLAELAFLLLGQGRAEEAWKRSMLAVEISRGLEDPVTEARAWLVAGHVFANLKMLDQGTRACQAALRLQRELGQSTMVAESLACLARISLDRDDLDEAHALADQILDRLAVCKPSGVSDPLRIYLTCYEVLAATEDPRAQDLLRKLVNLYGDVQQNLPISAWPNTPLAVGGETNG